MPAQTLLRFTHPNKNRGCLSPASPSQINQKQLNLIDILNQVQDLLLQIKDSGETIFLNLFYIYLFCRNNQ
jgi:hypothetical protein